MPCFGSEIFLTVLECRVGGNMFLSILDWAAIIVAIVAPFLVGVLLEHRLYPVERQWAARLGRG